SLKTSVSFPQFAIGGGWTSNIGLGNPTNAVQKGQMLFLLDDGTAATTMPYTITPRSSFKWNVGGNDLPVRTGQVRILPDAGPAAPDGILVYRYLQNGIIASETGVPAVQPARGIPETRQRNGRRPHRDRFSKHRWFTENSVSVSQ